MIFRCLVFTTGFALGAAAQALAQLQTPNPAPQLPPPTPAATASPSETPTETPSETPTEVPTQTPQPTIAPSPTPSATATATPTSTPVPPPTATPQNPYKYVVDPTPDPNASPDAPQILRIEVNDRIIHVGGQVAFRVTTTPNVASVILSVEGHQIGIPKASDGLFAGIQTLPSFIPPWFLRTYQVTFNALTADGKRAAATIPLTLSY